MKKYKNVLVIISMLILTCLLAGCGKKSIINSQQENEPQISEESETLNMSFEERIKEARDYMNLEDNLNIGSLGYMSGEHFISNASLDKKENYYEMKLQFSSSKLYDKEQIDNAYNLAQGNGTYVFEGDTFYKDYEFPFDSSHYDEEQYLAMQQWYEYLKIEGLLAKSEDGEMILFVNVPNDASKYCKVYPYFVGPPGYVKTALEKEIIVVLSPNDVISIYPASNVGNYTSDKEIVLTVSEFYERAINNEISSDDTIHGYEYNINDIGDSSGWYGEYTNAVNFEDGKIIVNFCNGGI